MPFISLRTLSSALPAFLLLAGFFSISRYSAIPVFWQNSALNILPVLTLATALLLSLQFNRSRLSYMLAFIAIAAWLILHKSTARALWPANIELFNLLHQQTLPLLFSLNIFFFSLTKDRGLLSVHSLLRLGFLTLQLLLLLQLPLNSIKPYLQTVFTQYLPEFNLLKATTPILLTSFAAALLLQCVTLIARRSSLDITFIGLHLCLAGFYLLADSSIAVPILLTTASLMAIVAILTDSHTMAYRDELTGLPSRRALTQLQLSLGRKYTIAMLDIDFFKKFNDTHGHDVGDEVLKMVAGQIGRVGGGGKAFRYGGEEFTVIFPGKTPEQAMAHCEQLRERIENYKMQLRTPKRPQKPQKNAKQAQKRGKTGSKQQPLSVTISIGLAQRDNSKKTPTQVIKGADQALYRAKKKGRNCVMT